MEDLFAGNMRWGGAYTTMIVSLLLSIQVGNSYGIFPFTLFCGPVDPCLSLIVVFRRIISGTPMVVRCSSKSFSLLVLVFHALFPFSDRTGLFFLQ